MSHTHAHQNCIPHQPDSFSERTDKQRETAVPNTSTKTDTLSQKDGGGRTKSMTSSAPERRKLLPKDEMKIQKYWGFLKDNIQLANVIDALIERGLYSPDQWLELKLKQVSSPEMVEEFLHHFLTLGPEAYNVFLETLRSNGYGNVACVLEGENTSSRFSFSGSSGSLKSRVGRPPNLSRTLSQSQSVSLPDPRNGASGDLEDAAGSAASGSGERVVRQEDLNRMKDEITEELRQLRKNIEQDRDEDRLGLQILQRKHTEMSETLIKATTDKETLEHELGELNETVKKLQAQIDKKAVEYEEIKKVNDKLKHHLDSTTGDLQREIREKEREKDEMHRALRTREIEYRRLQNMLETIKEEHEERLKRLKNVNKERIILERQVQSLGKEKKNLEVKIRSLEQHIRVLHENFFRDTGNIKLQLEKTKTQLEEKEKERSDLEKQLQQSVKENNDLKQRNQQLEESLLKSQDENEHLQQNFRQTELSSYAIPQFRAGTKANRAGWKPGRTTWK